MGATPSALVVLPLAATFTLAAAWLLTRRHGGAVLVGAVAAAAPLLAAEATVYKIGLVVIVVVAAVGLHVLVNWTGELSLAHATTMGLPAFAVAKLSADHGWSPVLLVPLAVVLGTLTGAVVGLPALRARELQVALVTLAAGVALDRFFFTKPWFVGGPGGAAVATPSLGPLRFATARSLYPVLVLFAALAVAAAFLLYRSKVGRGLRWVKAHPDGAAAFGIPVARYRLLAYALSGAYAGLAGGLTAMWVQRITPDAFPLSRSFTFLIIVALAGTGFVGGVAAASAAVEGGRLFVANGDAWITYAAPIGLILTLVQHPSGLNGFGRELAERGRSMTKTGKLRPLLAGGAVLVAVGFTAIGLAWYHAGNTNAVWVQNQELLSGGIGGLALVLVGIALSAYDRLLAFRVAESARWDALVGALERAAEPAATAPAARPAPRRVRRAAA